MLRHSQYMNRRQLLLTLGLGALAATATLARRQSDTRPPRIITTKESTYLIGKIEPVLTGKIDDVALAPAGRYALIQQDLRPERDPVTRRSFGEEKLWLYDSLRRTTKLIYRSQDDPQTQTLRMVMRILWFPGTTRALVMSTAMRYMPPLPGKQTELETRTELGIFDVERGTIRWLDGLLKELASAREVPSAREVQGLSGLLLEATQEKPKARVFSLLSPDGALKSLAQLPYEKEPPRFRGVSIEGKRLFFSIPIFEKNAVRTEWESFELVTGTRTKLTAPPSKTELTLPIQEPPRLPLGLYSAAAQVNGAAGRTANTTALWLEATVPGPEKKYARGLVTAEGDAAYLLPDLSSVLYTHDDALYAAPIATLDRLAFEKLMRQLAMNNAKQTGLALMMYAQDYDSNFPSDPASVKDAVFPYLMSREVLTDFVYTYTGPTGLNQIGQPATTALGYIPSPGGRAVLYGDGHVKWEPDPIK